MEIITKKVPCWLVWGLCTKDGDMQLLSVSLSYSHAKYVYETFKDDSSYIRVRIEPTEANHAYAGTSMLSVADSLVRDDIEGFKTYRKQYKGLFDLTRRIIKAYKEDDKQASDYLEKVFFEKFPR